jgi:hypothetical protein
MTTRCLLCASAILALPLLQPHVAAQSPPALTVVSAGPSGETSALEQANEIRVVFSHLHANTCSDEAGVSSFRSLWR